MSKIENELTFRQKERIKYSKLRSFKSMGGWGEVIGAVIGAVTGEMARRKEEKMQRTVLAMMKEGMDSQQGAGRDLLEKRIPELDELLDSKKFTKESAIEDSKASIENLFKQGANSSLPTIFNGALKTGAYDSTTTALMQNDAYSTTVNKAAELQMKTIMEYVTNGRKGELNELMGLLDINSNSRKQLGGIDIVGLGASAKKNQQEQNSDIGGIFKAGAKAASD